MAIELESSLEGKKQKQGEETVLRGIERTEAGESRAEQRGG